MSQIIHIDFKAAREAAIAAEKANEKHWLDTDASTLVLFLGVVVLLTIKYWGVV